MSHQKSFLAHQFNDLKQQHESAQLGMWAFLATEVLFFGGIFAAYVVYRNVYPEAFAEGSAHTELILGSINTAVLLTSSLTMALAFYAMHEREARRGVLYLVLTMLLGLVFLGIKAVEYYKEISEGLLPGASFALQQQSPVELFFVLYFVSTGLHALHVLAGIGLIGGVAWMVWRGRLSVEHSVPVELVGLYWHFVDCVWVFLYPLIYLIG